jgi:hypothetical protein
MTQLTFGQQRAAIEAAEKLGLLDVPLNKHGAVCLCNGFVSLLPPSEAELQPDFCDKNCTWRDHHPDCERAEPVAVTRLDLIAATEANDKLNELCREQTAEIERLHKTVRQLGTNAAEAAKAYRNHVATLEAALREAKEENAALRAELAAAKEYHEAYREEALEQLGELAALKAGDVVMVPSDVVQRINQWAEAYPLSVFPEPDFDAVQKALAANGLSLDCVSASNMRYVITKIRDMIAAAPGAQAGEKDNASVKGGA